MHGCPGPVTGLPRLPLSIRASTASWSMRFSLRTMISGAPSSSSLARRLFLLITLLYKIVKVGGGKTSAVQLYHRADIRRNNRNQHP